MFVKGIDELLIDGEISRQELLQRCFKIAATQAKLGRDGLNDGDTCDTEGEVHGD